MKELLAGIVLILVIGVAGFLYRNALEHPVVPNNPGGTVACTMEAKVCPDGTSVGRTGSDCHFSLCQPPNVELANLSLVFVLPAGYAENKKALGNDSTLIEAYEKSSKNPDAPHTIVIRDYPIPVGKTATSTIVAGTMYETSGNTAKSISEFKTKIINGKTYYTVVLERFEGQVHSAYYLPRTSDVLRFEVLERDVDWTNPKLNIEALPEHQALLKMLGTLQSP